MSETEVKMPELGSRSTLFWLEPFATEVYCSFPARIYNSREFDLHVNLDLLSLLQEINSYNINSHSGSPLLIADMNNLGNCLHSLSTDSTRFKLFPRNYRNRWNSEFKQILENSHCIPPKGIDFSKGDFCEPFLVLYSLLRPEHSPDSVMSVLDPERKFLEQPLFSEKTMGIVGASNSKVDYLAQVLGVESLPLSASSESSYFLNFARKLRDSGGLAARVE